MRVLITGGCGYIGSLFYGETPTNWQVDLLDNLEYGQRHLLAKVSSIDGFFETDVVDADWAAILPKYDVVVHLAALVGAPICNRRSRDRVFAVNAESVKNIVAHLRPDQHLIFPNSNSGYGVGGDGFCTESSPLNPISSYGESKCLGETYALSHPNTTVFRLATVFGASPRPRLDLMVNDFAYQMWKYRKLTIFEPHFKRNFVHIRDVCDAIRHAIFDPTVRGVYNLGNDAENMTKGELAQKIADFFGGTVEIGEGQDPDKRDYIVSSQKLAEDGFIAGWSLNDGLAELRSFFNTNKSDPASMRNA